MSLGAMTSRRLGIVTAIATAPSATRAFRRGACATGMSATSVVVDRAVKKGAMSRGSIGFAEPGREVHPTHPSHFS